MQSQPWSLLELPAVFFLLMIVLSNAELTNIKRMDLATHWVLGIGMPTQVLKIEAHQEGESNELYQWHDNIHHKKTIEQ